MRVLRSFGVVMGLFVAIMFPWNVSEAATATLDFAVATSGGCIDASTYLASFGITFVPVSSGATSQICSAVGSAIFPVSSPNFFFIGPSVTNTNVSGDLIFSTPVTEISFATAAVSSGTSVPGWDAQAYDASGTLLSSVGEPALFPGPGALSFTLTGPGITRLHFDAFNSARRTYNAPPIDHITLITSGPAITSPSDGASPQSQFVALSGTGEAGDTLSVLANGSPVGGGSIVVDPEGNWEALAFIGPFGPSVTIQVQDQVTFDSSQTITVHPFILPPLVGGTTVLGPAISDTQLLPLRKADIFVTADPSSPQVLLYGPTYTHTALYLGGDADGTPWVAEAVTSTEAEANIFGEVRSVPLEHSLAWNGAIIMTAWHPTSPLSGATRAAIVAWAQNITIQSLPYWSTTTFVNYIDGADFLFIATGGILNPRINGFFNQLNALKNSTSTFICSTLVWRAYWEGTGHTLDLSTPNNIGAAPGSILGNLPIPFKGAFIANLASVFVVPQTFVTSPKLSQIF